MAAEGMSNFKNQEGGGESLAMFQLKVGELFVGQRLKGTSLSPADDAIWASRRPDGGHLFTVHDVEDVTRTLGINLNRGAIPGTLAHAVVVGSSQSSSSFLQLHFRQLSPFQHHHSAKSEPESFRHLTWMVELTFPDLGNTSPQWFALQWVGERLALSPWRDAGEQRVEYYTRTMRAMFVPGPTSTTTDDFADACRRYFLDLDLQLYPVDERLVSTGIYAKWVAIESVPTQRGFFALANATSQPAQFIAIDNTSQRGVGISNILKLTTLPLAPDNEAQFLVFRPTDINDSQRNADGGSSSKEECSRRPYETLVSTDFSWSGKAVPVSHTVAPSSSRLIHAPSDKESNALFLQIVVL